MKPLEFLGDSLDRVRAFPNDARARTGFQLGDVQNGREPDDWKPMPTVGSGVRELRIRVASGAFRVIYLASQADRILVLHAFTKKTQATSKRDLDLATERLREWRR